jgi:hypothetical protein
LGPEVANSEQYRGIPTKLNCRQFEQFVLPHLSTGGRGPAPKLSLHAIFNYILQQLYMGCQWKELPIEKDREGHPEIHYTYWLRVLPFLAREEQRAEQGFDVSQCQ